ncbi:MAG: Rho termination factor N-terminal domain-containing protein [Kiritimatiellaeota bacterium]|nr:Rho termination factor N-terminal domain-containing protein [Kiritimatiellota bacterium]
MVRYAVNIHDNRVVVATEETVRQSAYRGISARTAMDIKDGRIAAKDVVWQIMRRENTQGRSRDDVENQRPDNIRKVVFRPEPDDGGGDGGFTAVLPKGGKGNSPADDGGGNAGGAPSPADGDAPPDGGGEVLENMTAEELRRKADALGISVKKMNKAEMAAMIRANQPPAE